MLKKIKNWACLTAMAALALSFNACSNDLDEVVSGSPSLKSTTIGQVGSMYIYRNPDGDTIGASVTYGIDLTSDSQTSFTSTITTSTAGHQMYFYNEKVYTSTADTVGVGCPALFLGSGVTGYKTLLTGTTGFSTLDSTDIAVTYTSDASATLPLPYNTTFRNANDALIKSYVKTTYYPTFVIGNSFQGLATASQPVYIIRVSGESENYYYAFMVSLFKNGSVHTDDPATDMYTMTVIYKLLYIEEAEE